MTRTAAERADGLLVMPFNSVLHFTQRTLPALAEGLRRANKSSEGFQVIAQVMVAVGRTDAELAAAINGVASLIAFYGSTPAYLPVLEVEGWADIQPELNTLSKAGGFVQMRELITEEMVQTIGIVGTPEECAAEIHDRFGAHASDVCCYFPGYIPRDADVADLIDELQQKATQP
jgi:probable F420-dependent oxidoreductase